MKKKKELILIAVAVIFIIAVVAITLRYNVYPYLFCGPNHPDRNKQNIFVCEDLDGNEVGTVCMDIRLSRFSRYYKGETYEVEDYHDLIEFGNYLTDKKIPKRVRDNLPLLASEKDVLVIFGVAVSDKIKVDQTTKTIIKFE